MELLQELSWVDLAIVGALAGGVFAGFTQGMIRYILNGVAVLVAFVLASQLKGPLVELLGFWEAFTEQGRQLLIFNILFFGFTIAGFFVIRTLYHRTRLPIARQLDEIGGAIFGLLFTVLVICFSLLVLDSFFEAGGQTSGWVAGWYDAMNDSIIIEFFRNTVIPYAAFMVRPFVPSEIADILPLP